MYFCLYRKGRKLISASECESWRPAEKKEEKRLIKNTILLPKYKILKILNIYLKKFFKFWPAINTLYVQEICHLSAIIDVHNVQKRTHQLATFFLALTASSFAMNGFLCPEKKMRSKIIHFGKKDFYGIEVFCAKTAKWSHENSKIHWFYKIFG